MFSVESNAPALKKQHYKELGNENSTIASNHF